MFWKMFVRVSCLVLRVFSLSNRMLFSFHRNSVYLLYSRVYLPFDRTAYCHRYNSPTTVWDMRTVEVNFVPWKKRENRNTIWQDCRNIKSRYTSCTEKKSWAITSRVCLQYYVLKLKLIYQQN